MDAADWRRVAAVVVALCAAAGGATAGNPEAAAVAGDRVEQGGDRAEQGGDQAEQWDDRAEAELRPSPGGSKTSRLSPPSEQTTTPTPGDGPGINESEPPFDARTDGESLVIVVENGSTRLTARVNYSLLAGIPDPGQLRLRATGDLGDERVVALTAGVRFEGAPSATAFATDPLRYVEVLYDYRFSLPFPTSPEEVVDGHGPADI